MLSSGSSTSHDFRTFQSNNTIFPLSFPRFCLFLSTYWRKLEELLWCFRKLPNFHSCHIVGMSMGKKHKIVGVHSDLPPHLALFCDITQCVVVIPFRRFGTNYRSRRRKSQEIVICCVTSQKRADLMYFAAEAWNQSFVFPTHVGCSVWNVRNASLYTV